MGLRFRKSISLGKGARVNLSKSGIGYSFGTKGARITKRARGGWSGSVGIPGTGVYYTKSLSTKHSSSSYAGGGFLSALFSVFYFFLWLTWQTVKWTCIGMLYLCKYTIIAIGWIVDKLVEGGIWLYHYIREKHEQHKNSPQ